MKRMLLTSTLLVSGCAVFDGSEEIMANPKARIVCQVDENYQRVYKAFRENTRDGVATWLLTSTHASGALYSDLGEASFEIGQEGPYGIQLFNVYHISDSGGTRTNLISAAKVDSDAKRLRENTESLLGMELQNCSTEIGSDD